MGEGKMIAINFDEKKVIGKCKAKDFKKDFEEFREVMFGGKP